MGATVSGMTQGAWPYHPPKPPVSTADLVVSIVTLIVTVSVGGAGALMGLFMLAFLDHCPPATCSVDGAVTAVASAVFAAGLVVLVGIVATTIALVRRKPAWPFAIATLMLCVAVLVLGGVWYDGAVGG